MDKYILVGAKPTEDKDQNPGGQLTASLGLLSYADSVGTSVDVIDTLRPSFPPPSLGLLLLNAVKRILKLVLLLCGGKIKGVIIFAGAGKSFNERIIMSALCKLFGVKDLFLVRDGWFMVEMDSATNLKRSIVSRLLDFPHRIGASGANWMDFYDKLNVDSKKLVYVRNWLPQGFSPVKTAKSVKPNIPVHFIFTGWLVPEKGIHEIVEAIRFLSSSWSFKFSFVGGGTLEKYVSEQIVKNKWDDFVFVHGWKNAEEIMSLYEYADVFVLPSYAEGFPNSMIEAMACGLPAICSDVGGVSDTLRNGVTGYLIQPHDTAELTNAMRMYIEKPELVGVHSQTALDIVKRNHSLLANCESIFGAFD